MELVEEIYDREKAVAYARRWAFGRNPQYYDFSRLGGDCTNYASQVIFAGAGQMNFTPTFGWYYRSLSDRTPSWTGVEYLYNFLVNNEGEGPFAKEVPPEKLEKGDVVQLGRSTGDWYHTPVVVGFSSQTPTPARPQPPRGPPQSQLRLFSTSRPAAPPPRPPPPRGNIYSIPFSLRMRLTSRSNPFSPGV